MLKCFATYQPKMKIVTLKSLLMASVPFISEQPSYIYTNGQKKGYTVCMSNYEIVNLKNSDFLT